MEEEIKTFLFGSGYGYGYGSGDGSGYGYGDGSGSGDGSGYGDGSGDGYGYGSGSGYGDGDGDGDGDGSGSGSGYGSGYGYGSGSGYGDGDGDGDGDGSGSGYGYGEKLKKTKGQNVYYIDGIPCLFVSVKGNSARVLVIDKQSFELSPAFVAKMSGKFAHGETLREAVAAVQEKVFEDMDFSEKKKTFFEMFPSKTILYKTLEFYKWHHIITGSCEFGRKRFAEEKGIDLNGEMTVTEFFDLTRSEYNGRMIQELESMY